MRLRLPAAGVILTLFAAIVAGCSSSTSPTAPSPATDAGQVSATLAASLSLVDDGLAEDSTQVSAAAALTYSGARPAAIIRPFTWRQHVTRETRTWDFVWSDTDSTGRPRTVVVTLHKHLTGEFVIVPVSPGDSTRADSIRYVKPLDKMLTRKIMLQRILINGVRVWKIVEVTGAFVTTPGSTTHILSVRLQSKSGVDTTITDPLQWLSLRHIVQFGADDSVTVTVTTNHTNDVVYIHRWDWRHRLHDNLNGTYSFTWVTSPWSGWRHFAIQAMSHGTLYDSVAPVELEAWHEPFRVVGGQPDVDYYP